MAGDTNTAGETDRVTVRVHVPRYQKAEWERHAEELDMGLSEYVRSMVQSGRVPFDETGEGTSAGTGCTRPGTASTEPVEEMVLDTLDDTEHLTWEEIVEATIGDVETALESALQDLMDQERVEHTPRNGGYRRTD